MKPVPLFITYIIGFIIFYKFIIFIGFEQKLFSMLFSNKELMAKLNAFNIQPVPKDMLGVRVGIVNKEGTALLLKFKDEMLKLADLMPFSDQYTQV